VVVLSKFPLYDEVFLLRELRALAERFDLYILSLRPPGDVLVHDQARPLLPHHLAPHFLFSRRVLRAQLRTLLDRPGAYLRALLRVVARYRRSPRFLLGNLAFFPKAVYLADWARQEGASHLHGGWATFPADVVMTAAELSGLPWSFAGHAHDIYVDATGLPEKLRAAAFVATCTAANRDHMLRLVPGLPDDRVAVLHHGIVVADFETPPRHATRPLEILSVGTLFPHKGFGPLLDALQLLDRRGLDFRCTIVGGGPLRTSLEDQARRHGLGPRVVFTGPLKQSDLVPLYRRSAVFVLVAQPEWHWGIPNVVIEALAARNAVITTRFGSVEELVRDDVTGLLVPPRSPEALAGALAALADDELRRHRLAEAGHARVVADFDLGRTVEGYVSRIEEAIRSGRPATALPGARA
jgi:colanic acid/amylovoran biosynthesis glycosyltransferase